jgi:guanine deaminase
LSCSDELSKGLAEIAKKNNLLIQTHLSENLNEIKIVSELYPNKTYTQVYDDQNLLQKNTILAHCIHLSDEEVDLIKKRESSISHCPLSNFTIISGVMNTKKYLDKEVKIGLGTDCSGGYSPSILNALRNSMIATNSKHFENQESKN